MSDDDLIAEVRANRSAMDSAAIDLCDRLEAANGRVHFLDQRVRYLYAAIDALGNPQLPQSFIEKHGR